MEKIDARKLSPRELSKKRKIAMKLREKGISNKEVSEKVGISPQSISKYYTQYKKDTEKIFNVKNAGRPKNVSKTFSNEQEQRIIKLLIHKNPKEFQSKFRLWTRESVKQLIFNELNIDLPISTVGYYLARWKFTSKSVNKKGDSVTKTWLKDTYLQIRKEAKKNNGNIWRCNKTACISLPSNLKNYALIESKTKPILTHSDKKFKVNIICTTTNTGKSMFTLYNESIATDNFIDFLEKVIESNNKKIFMILDNKIVHHSKKVREYEEKNKEKIKIFYLPQSL